MGLLEAILYLCFLFVIFFLSAILFLCFDSTVCNTYSPLESRLFLFDILNIYSILVRELYHIYIFIGVVSIYNFMCCNDCLC